MKKRVRHVNRAEANKEIQVAHDNRKVAKQLSEAMVSFAGMKTLEEIDIYLNEKTGFVNTQLSAEAMGLGEQYQLVSKYLGSVDLKIYDKNWVVKQSYKDKMFEKYTTYYSDEDIKLFDEVEKVLEKLNALNLPNGCLRSDHTGQIKFFDNSFNLARQFSQSSRSFAEKQSKAKEIIDAVKKPNKSIVEQVRQN
jgi:hypothetical protein